MHGTYETIEGRPAVRFERRLAHPVDAVWRAVTEPAELAHWFPGDPPAPGDITEEDPPRLRAWRWGEEGDQLRLELAEAGDGCVLTLTHTLAAREQAARDAAGWHVCLDRLETALAGDDAQAPGEEPTSEWREHFEEYERRGLPTGAPVPDGA
jgi:hypothetical protein